MKAARYTIYYYSMVMELHNKRMDANIPEKLHAYS